MIFPEDLAAFVFCLLPLAAFAALAWIFLHLRARWHVDAERSHALIVSAQVALARSVGLGSGTFLVLSVAALACAFVLLSTLQWRWGWAHLLAILIGLLSLFLTLKGYSDSLSVVLLVTILAVTPLLYTVAFGRRAFGPLICFAVASLLLLRFY